MRILAVDIGTNSVRSIICDIDDNGVISVVHRGGEITRLGQDLHATGALDPKAVERTADAVATIVDNAQKLNVEKTILAATSAARDAKNSQYFIQKIKERTGTVPEILSGMREAQTIYRGVVHEISDPCENLVILDIGGGSTECICHPVSGEITLNSVDIGAVRMTDRFIRNDPPRADELREMRSFVEKTFRDGVRSECLSGMKLIGVGGTITTLAAILLELEVYDHNKVHGYFMTRKAVGTTLERLASMDLEQRKFVAGLSPKRADIIIAGIVVLEAFLDFAEFNELRVSDRGILFGLALEASGL